jgi:hypothetical protein
LALGLWAAGGCTSTTGRSVTETAGNAQAGTSGAAGTASGTGGDNVAGATGPGTAGSTGSGGVGTTGAAGAVDAAVDQAMGGSDGDMTTTGAAGDGTAGSGSAGTIGSSGAAGTIGSPGAAGGVGTAGMTGAAGMMGTAGTGGAGGAAPTCGLGTCPNGCCDNGRCMAGRSVDHCGTGGVTCEPCGGCQVCNDAGFCDVDPASTWDIICAQATIAMSPPGGGTWDPHTSGGDGTAPDPFCEFEMPAHMVTAATAGVTPTLPDTFTPVWNADVTPQGKAIKASDLMSTSKTWRLWVGDADGCCTGQEICEIDQPLTAGALLAGQVVHENLMSCLSLTVKFVCTQ